MPNSESVPTTVGGAVGRFVGKAKAAVGSLIGNDDLQREGNLQRAHVMARSMEAGMIWINCYKRFHPGSPFGGIKDSGYGREMGHFAMHEYTEPKSVWVNVDAKLPVFYPR